MKRRNFLAGIPTGYSLMYFAGSAPTNAAPAEDLKRDFEKIAPPARVRKMSSVEAHMVQVDLETEILIAGGGVAGVCAALAAARHGSKVVLVQDRSRLGGNSSSEVKMHIVGANCHKGRPGWREAESSKNCASTMLRTIRSAAGKCGTCCSMTRSSASRTSRCCWRARFMRHR